MIKITRQKQVPIKREKIISEDDEVFYDYMKNVFRRINSMFTDLVDSLQWTPQYYAQDTEPSPDSRELVVWKDTSATSGDPTHYIVTKTPDGNTVKFPSAETV